MILGWCTNRRLIPIPQCRRCRIPISIFNPVLGKADFRRWWSSPLNYKGGKRTEGWSGQESLGGSSAACNFKEPVAPLGPNISLYNNWHTFQQDSFPHILYLKQFYWLVWLSCYRYVFNYYIYTMKLYHGCNNIKLLAFTIFINLYSLLWNLFQCGKFPQNFGKTSASMK